MQKAGGDHKREAVEQRVAAGGQFSAMGMAICVGGVMAIGMTSMVSISIIIDTSKEDLVFADL